MQERDLPFPARSRPSVTAKERSSWRETLSSLFASLSPSYILVESLTNLLLSRLVTPALASISLARTFSSHCSAMPPTLIFQPLASPSLANDNGVAITQLFKDGGPGTTVLLVQRATYVLYTAIDFVHPQTTLATVDYPTFDSGNQAILETRGEKEAGAINMYNKAETSLKRLHIRGCRGWGRHKPETKEEEERLRQAGGHGWVEGGGALVWMGGPESHDSMVEGCRLEDPRGWTAVRGPREFAVQLELSAHFLRLLLGPCL